MWPLHMYEKRNNEKFTYQFKSHARCYQSPAENPYDLKI